MFVKRNTIRSSSCDLVFWLAMLVMIISTFEFMDFIAKKENTEAKEEGEDTIVIRVCDSVMAELESSHAVGGQFCPFPREEQHQDEEGVQELLRQDGT